MNKFYFSILLSFIIAIIDILPMIIKKLPKYSIVASFVHFFVATIVIVNINIPIFSWWLEGCVLGFLLILPILIHISQHDKKPLPIIAFNAIFFGFIAKLATYAVFE